MNLNDKLLLKLKKIISDNGAEGFLVGGCIRNELLGLEIDDYDLEVYGITGEELRELLYKNFDVIEVGKSFGIFNIKHSDIDIALPRKENKIGIKHQDFLIETDPFLDKKSACLRRDFTINALMKNLNTEEILDFNGGLKDLKEKIIRHNNDKKFSEDALRVIRAARFSATLDFKIARETKQLCSKISLEHLSKERVYNELFKMFKKRITASRFFYVLKKMNQLSYWFKELDCLSNNEFDKTMKLLDAYKDSSFNNFLYILLFFVDKKEMFLKRLTNNKELINYILKTDLIYKELKDRKINYIEAYDKVKDFKEFSELLKYIDQDMHSNFNNSYGDYQKFLKRDVIDGKFLMELGFKQGLILGEIIEFSKKMEYQALSREEIVELILVNYKK